MEFLSYEWYEAANLALEELEVDRVDLVVAYVSEASSHSIVLANGAVSVRPGADAADVTFRMAAAVAEAVRQGSLSALTALQEGDIGLEGDARLLRQCQGALAAVDRLLMALGTPDS